MKPCTATIDLNAILMNLSVIKKRAPGCEVVAMVKANGYGHGITEVSRVLSRGGVKRFGVATLAEGVALRESGIDGDILLVSGATWLDYPDMLLHARLTPLVSSVEELAHLAHFISAQKLDGPFKIHLDLDTGMARTGFYVGHGDFGELNEALNLLGSNPALTIEGICTHFAHAQEMQQGYAEEQQHYFDTALAHIESRGFRSSVIHTAHSAALLRGLSKKSRGFTNSTPQFWVRPGILLYGVNPVPEHSDVSQELVPAMRFEAPIVARKRVPAGTFVGYGCTHRVERESELAVLGVGYADGYNRQLSNKGRVGIAGRFAPVIGRISMDMTAVDVTDIVREFGTNAAALGTAATLIGPVGDDAITAQEVGKHCHTISYEIFTSISKRVRREYIDIER